MMVIGDRARVRIIIANTGGIDTTAIGATATGAATNLHRHHRRIVGTIGYDKEPCGRSLASPFFLTVNFFTLRMLAPRF